MSVRRCQICNSFLSRYNESAVCFRHTTHPDFLIYSTIAEPIHETTICSSPTRTGIEIINLEYFGNRNG